MFRVTRLSEPWKCYTTTVGDIQNVWLMTQLQNTHTACSRCVRKQYSYIRLLFVSSALLFPLTPFLLLVLFFSFSIIPSSHLKHTEKKRFGVSQNCFVVGQTPGYQITKQLVVGLTPVKFFLLLIGLNWKHLVNKFVTNIDKVIISWTDLPLVLVVKTTRF